MLKILLVEDSQADTDLILRALRELPGRFEHARVASESGLRNALVEYDPDLILSDFSMPGFSGQEALKISLALAPDTPFLFVSGTIGEELAIDTLQSGAVDYVLKDNLRRLPGAIGRALDIAEARRDRERMEHALRASEERFRAIVESSNDWIWERDLDTRTTYSNGAVFSILGYTPEQILGRKALDLMLEEDREQALRRLPRLLEHGEPWQSWRLRWRHQNNGIRVLESTAAPVFDEQGTVTGYRGIDRDITDAIDQEAQIRHLARIHSVLGGLGNVVLHDRSRDGLLGKMCQVAVEKGGFSAACIYQSSADGHALGLTHSFGNPALIDFIARQAQVHDDVPTADAVRPALRALHERRKVIIRDYENDDGILAERRTRMANLGIRSQASLPIGSPPWGVMCLYAREFQAFDDEELELLQRLTDEIDHAVEFMANSERLEFLAFHNPVSGFLNRLAFLAKLEALMRTSSVCVAVVDITHFAAVNESRGRAFGDRLLQLTGRRLRELVDAETIVAHPEADSFALAYRTTGDTDAEANRLKALIRSFARQPFELDGSEIRIDLRGGLALAPEHGDVAEAVEQSAFAAMLEGARRGATVHVFNEELRGRAARRLDLENELKRAIKKFEFELYYQPKFEAATQRLAGAEALLRWQHPQRGPISPAEFIPILEESDLIIPVGRWVMREALRMALHWRDHYADLRIAVNVSSRELRHPRFIEQCTELLLDHTENQPLDIEVTESLLMDDIGQSMSVLQSVRELGCKIAIDDFGTGYSSLNYLARLPVDSIKIDQSFVALMTQSPETMGLVTNIINLAHSLSLQTVAEGVEEEEQMKLLRLLRCDHLQGYLLGRPMPADAFAQAFLTSAA
ncbi:MAG: EAL domain-containing protein [Dokdonella sp.]|nr:EAL domain-containing protein [Dokdonella sp.]MCB1574064.1 EAL domain-containing protein [Xanthomonadales bacterium]